MIFKKINRVYNWMILIILAKSFTVLQKLGLHVTQNHFYQPIPDTRTLKDDLWLNNSELVGININEQYQMHLLSDLSSTYKEEYEAFPLNKNEVEVPYQYYVNNGGFESVDGEVLYCMIRHFMPNRVLEVGSGNSTYLSAQAILKNETEYKRKCELIAIEPYPNDVLKAGFSGLSKLIPLKIQDIPLTEFSKLKENDILFIDSSHVLKIGSDVQYEYLEILPRLNKGVIVHIHDIFLPAEYRKEWILKNHTFWNEQYLLQAFLTFNESFEILWGGSYMHLNHPDKLEAAFRSYKRNERWPGSFWMKKIK